MIQEKQKIIHLVSSFPPFRGGTGNACFDFCKGLFKKGFLVEVITPKFNNLKINSAKFSFLVKYMNPLFVFGKGAVLWQIFSLVRKRDILHLHYPFFGTAELVILKKIFSPSMRLFVHYHMDADARGLKGLIFKIYQYSVLPILIRFAEKITCASIDYIKESFLKNYYQKNPKKFVETGFCVDEKKFFFQEIKENRNNWHILFVGNLDTSYHDKGLGVLLKALAEIKDKYKFFLRIIGEGNLKEKYQKLSEKLGLESNVRFLGKVDDQKLVDSYHESDFFVLPFVEKGEAFGIVLLEAMSCGRAILVSNLPGPRAVFENTKQGFLVKAGDISDLKNKIISFFENRQLIKKMGENGQKLVKEKYTPEVVISKLIRVYEL